MRVIHKMVGRILGRAVLALAVGMIVVAVAASFSCAAEKAEGFSVEETESGVTVKVGGELFTKYVIGEGNKPFLWPVIGPTGKRMTRAYPMEEAEGEEADHPHHRSVWFGYQGMGGCDTWHEPATWKGPKLEARRKTLGSIEHKEFVELSADGEKAVVVTRNDHVAGDGTKVMEDERRFVFWEEGGVRGMDVNIALVATGKLKLDAAKDAGFSVRVAHSMCVDAGEGGTIVNSEGDRDKKAWGKAAKWCDYSGPVEGERRGVAILSHPSSFRHPTTWHVRSYGLFTANPFMTMEGPLELEKGGRILLRYRVLFHEGDEKEAGIAEAYERYAKESF